MSMLKICPKCGAIAGLDSYFGGTRCTRCDFVEKPKPTNADRIRSMTDEELAEWLDNNTYQFPIYKDWLEWLKKEAGNG